MRASWVAPRLGRSGSAAIEFALVAPILVTMLLGAYDIGPSLMVRFKSASATQSVADLASQTATIQTADVANFFGAGADGMLPFSASNLSLRISNVASDGKGRAFVYWSCAQGTLPPLAATSTFSATPTGTAVSDLLLLTQGANGSFYTNGTNTSFIMVESSYPFTAPAGLIFRSQQTITNTAYAIPRVSAYIGPTNGDPTYVPTAPTSITFSLTVSVSNVTCNVSI